MSQIRSNAAIIGWSYGGRMVEVFFTKIREYAENRIIIPARVLASFAGVKDG